ncbi:MAG: cytidine deaminase [Nitriliruptoraceae bacterium]|nr:cytidine deaminase [Nitriliruptoraceae bacterium]
MRPDEVTYDPNQLLRQARELRARAYVPYSGFHVGAVLVTEDGQVFEGVNVENASYRLTSCAEQSAITGMVSQGVTGPLRVVAVVGDGATTVTPCGACRQTILEFGPQATVFAAGADDLEGSTIERSIAQLLPAGFDRDRLLDEGP